RRPRLPLARRAPGAAPPADQDQGGLAQARARLGSRPPPLGGRAHDLLASPVPTPARALRAPRRHPPSAAHDRLLPDLLQAASGRRDILKGALSEAFLSALFEPQNILAVARVGSALVSDRRCIVCGASA